MTKQEEIGRGIRANLLIAIKWAVDEGMTEAYLNLHVEEMLKMLRSQGVVIKVDRDNEIGRIRELFLDMGCGYSQADSYKEALVKASYVAVEPLIEEKE